MRVCQTGWAQQGEIGSRRFADTFLGRRLALARVTVSGVANRIEDLAKRSEGLGWPGVDETEGLMGQADPGPACLRASQ